MHSISYYFQFPDKLPMLTAFRILGITVNQNNYWNDEEYFTSSKNDGKDYITQWRWFFQIVATLNIINFVNNLFIYFLAKSPEHVVVSCLHYCIHHWRVGNFMTLICPAQLIVWSLDKNLILLIIPSYK